MIDVPNVNVLLNDTAIENSLPNNDESKGLPHGNTSPYAILLLNAQSKKATAKGFNLVKNANSNSNTYSERPVTASNLLAL